MSIEQEAKEFVEDRKLEPVALQCGSCLKWSGYNLENNNKTPRCWVETDNGFYCGGCKNKGK